MKILVLIALCVLSNAPAFAASHYVWCAASGTASGADFTNATTDLPTSLTRGDTYIIAGSVSCNYASHTFQDVESGTTLITIRKAQAVNDSGVAGWQASFASAVAKWTESTDADPAHEGGSHFSFWRICRSYYTLDGITGTTDPIGGVGGQGFLLSSPNRFSTGLIYVSTNGCGAAGNVTLTNITIAHVEGTNVYDYSPAAVTVCSYAGGVATITTASTAWPQGWVVGDQVAGFTSAQSTIFSATAIATVPSLLTQFTVALGSTPCATLSTVALEHPAGPAVYATYTTDNFNNLTLQYDYLHLTSGDSLDLYNRTLGSGTLIEHNWFERNRGTATQHSQPMAGQANDTLTVRYNTFKDVTGTGILVNIGNGPGPSSNWAFYGNLIFETGTAPNTGITSLVESICTGGINTMVVYNNTIINQIGGVWDGNTGIIDSGNCSNAGSWTVENNLWYGSIQVDKNYAAIGTADYNTLLNTAWSAGSASNTHDFQTNSGSATPFVSIASSNFQLSSETVVAHLNDGLSLSSPYNVDFSAITRGTDGTWERGAYEFTGALLGVGIGANIGIGQNVGIR